MSRDASPTVLGGHAMSMENLSQSQLSLLSSYRCLMQLFSYIRINFDPTQNSLFSDLTPSILLHASSLKSLIFLSPLLILSICIIIAKLAALTLRLLSFHPAGYDTILAAVARPVDKSPVIAKLYQASREWRTSCVHRLSDALILKP